MLRLMSLLAGFCASWGALARFWRLPRGSGEGFGCPKALFFEVFLPAHACNAKKARQAFCIGKTNTKRMSAIQRTTLKTNKIRPGRLSNNVFCQDCAKNLSWRSPSSVLEGSGSLGGSSWVHLAGFWVLLGGSWPLLGASWAPLGRLLGALGRMLSAKSVPGLDFGRFGRLPGWVLEGFRGTFWHAFRCAPHS